MRPLVGIAGAGAQRPTSRVRARSPAGPGASPSIRQSQTSGFSFQSGSPNPRASGSVPAAGPPAAGGGPVGGSREYGSGVFNLPAGVNASRGSQVGPTRSNRDSRLSVVVRKRPMNRREAQAAQQDVVFCTNCSVIVREPKLKVDLTRYVEEHSFLFDQAFDEGVTNDQLYDSCVRPVIDAVFQQAKCTCFAYGQTGSGKTFTMMGPHKRQLEGLPESDRTPGIFLLAARDLFRGLTSKEYSHLGVWVAFYEIYCGKLFDLLNNRQILHARENAKANVVIVGLQEHPVQNAQELMEVIDLGLASRTTGITGANVDSSRSHAILQICLRDSRTKDVDGKFKEHGKISFIDLAGSERGADTMDTNRQTRMDGAEINKSLLALKECIRALDQQHDHTPFRGSKLTQVLKDSFVGTNCRTVMIANVSPCGCAVEHSLNTLRYAYRVKELRKANVPSINELGGPLMGPEDFAVGGPVVQHGANGGPVELIVGEERLSDDDQPSDGGLLGDIRSPRAGGGPGAGPPTAAPPYHMGGGYLAQQPQYHQPQYLQQQMPPEEAGPPPQQRLSTSIGSVTAGLHGGNSRSNLSGLEAAAFGGGDGSGPAQHMQRGHGGYLESAHQRQEIAPEVALEPAGNCSQAALDELARQHDRLIGTILAEEEELITAHRQHIDSMVELIKEEMLHLNNVDRPGSDVDAYVAGLDRILRLKADYIGSIRQRVDTFKEHLQQEDALSKKFQSLASSSVG